MTQDQTFVGMQRADIGLDAMECLGDEIIILGLREGFANLAIPNSDDSPVDHPTRGIVLGRGGDVIADEKKKIMDGMVIYFPKFSAGEIHVGGRRLFTVKLGDVKIKHQMTEEELATLAKNSF